MRLVVFTLHRTLIGTLKTVLRL